MGGNILTMGKRVITVGANIITADRNAITMGTNVITSGRDVISGNNILCPLLLVIYHKMGDYHPWSQQRTQKHWTEIWEHRPGKKCAVIKIDQYTAWRHLGAEQSWMRKCFLSRDQTSGFRESQHISYLQAVRSRFLSQNLVLRSKRSSHLAAR